MSDLVARLRAQAEAARTATEGETVARFIAWARGVVPEHEVALREAADEIERLGTLYSDQFEEFDRFLDDLAFALAEWDGDLNPETVLAQVKALRSFATLASKVLPVAREVVFIDADAQAEAPMSTLAVRHKCLDAIDAAESAARALLAPPTEGEE